MNGGRRGMVLNWKGLEPVRIQLWQGEKGGSSLNKKKGDKS